jgi:hypothetical protein
MDKIELFLNWYFGLFTDNDNKVKLAAWSATITTLTFIITFFIKPIRVYLLGLFKKIKVVSTIRQTILQSNYAVSINSPVLSCYITNKFDKTVFIKRISIELSRKINGDNLFDCLSANTTGRFPTELKSGQQVNFDYNLIDLNNQVLINLKQNDKVRFVVYLTIDKKYLSNYISMKYISENLSIAKNIR